MRNNTVKMCLVLAAVSLAAEVPLASAAGPFTVANSSPVGLIASTGNLYWTSEYLNEFGPSSTWVFRASKNNTSGNEIVLYEESGPTRPWFGGVVYANVGAWYGYFIANYGDSFSYIKRVPLAGGAATIIATPPAFVGGRDLKTDGSYLYWADAGGIRRVPIGGGAITTLVSNTTSRHLSLDASYIYFDAGTSIRRVPKIGGAVTTQAIASSAVTDLYIYVTATGNTIYWSEEGAAVKSRVVGATTNTTHQPTIAGRRASSVGFDGSRVLWIDCTAPGNSFCRVRKRQGSVTTTIVGVAGVGASYLVWDSTQVFWGTASQLKKYVH